MLVQKLRLQRGWSQEQLAELSGLSVRTIQRVERGQPASLETLQALGTVFNLDISALKEPAMTATPDQASTGLSPEETLALAHVRRVKGFYIHLTQYVIVNTLLIAINLLTFHRYFWAIWPLLGWGIGLLNHGLRVFDLIPLFGSEWERRAVERRLGRKL
jgi:transcriptional regulator with XRE-family HTH domain